MVPDKNSGNQGSENQGPTSYSHTCVTDKKQNDDDFNAMDQKFAQIIAFNGVIFGGFVIGIDPAKAAHFPVCLGGIVIIFASAFLSGIVYSLKNMTMVLKISGQDGMIVKMIPGGYATPEQINETVLSKKTKC